MFTLLKKISAPPKKLYLLFLVLAVIVLVSLGQFFGFFWYNSLLTLNYSTRGLDVSHHQGEINWQQVGQTKKYLFAYIKATEGHDFIDDEFMTNWTEAKIAGLKVGAYHFFSMRSSGFEQAQYFIQQVPKEKNSLAPVIDIEIALDHDPTKVRQELKQLAYALEDHYQKRPILYVTYPTYNQYIRNYFNDYDIWIRDVYKQPNLEGKDWLIWQYNNRARIKGIETYVDINVVKNDLDSLQVFTSEFRSPRVEEVYLKTYKLYDALSSYPPYYADDIEKVNIPKQWQETVILAEEYLRIAGDQGNKKDVMWLYYYLGELYRMGHNLDRPSAFEKSAEHFSTAINIEPTFENTNGLATLLVNVGYGEDAEELMMMAMSKAKTQRQKIAVYQGLFFARVYQLRVKDAIKALDEGLQLDPENQRLLDLKKIYEQREEEH